MSTVTAKEKNMLMVIIVLVLYAVAALCFRKQQTKWKTHGNVLRNARKKYAQECALIDASNEWDDKYKTMCSLMPVFLYDKDVATHWLNTMDTVASEHKLVISRRQIGKEEEVGDVFELPVECKNWEGSLESLVGFLYGLHKEGAMLDVRQLFVKPSSNPGYLKGTFSLNCAYMRGDVVEEDSVFEPSAEKDTAVVREFAETEEVVPATPKPAAMNAPIVPGPKSAVPAKAIAVPAKAVAVPALQIKENSLRTEIKGVDDKAAQQSMEKAAVKAALRSLEKASE